MEPSIAPDSHLQLRYEKYKGILKEFTLMSDIFMRNVFKKRKCTEHVLRIIMNRMELKVIDQIIQKDYKNLQGRSAILDCVARDSEGRQFDVEEQQESEGASPKRARYHSGLMDLKSRLSKWIRGRAAQQHSCLLMCSSAIRRRLISVGDFNPLLR